ncbi:MAG: Hpt domain-containing protein [Myxococcota bacterium]|nr:Hpt domain-containing protein [Myxococcota bacterium]
MSDILDLVIIDSLKQIKKEGFCERLVELFETNTAGLAREMGEAIERGDPALLAEKAHSLCSASSSVGALRVSSLARELEALGSAGNTEGTYELYTTLLQQLSLGQEVLKTTLLGTQGTL